MLAKHQPHHTAAWRGLHPRGRHRPRDPQPPAVAEGSVRPLRPTQALGAEADGPFSLQLCHMVLSLGDGCHARMLLCLHILYFLKFVFIVNCAFNICMCVDIPTHILQIYTYMCIHTFIVFAAKNRSQKHHPHFVLIADFDDLYFAQFAHCTHQFFVVHGIISHASIPALLLMWQTSLCIHVPQFL